ncbi:MAG: DUF4330 domain-containing protein [Clostridia bacterium]|nr:DUF4330 domain-containing protein [Clostridia bacterium]
MASETQKKHRFNIVDFVLVIAVLACVIGLGIRYNLHSNLTHSGDYAEVTVLIERLLNTTAENLNVGDTFYNPFTEKEFGEVISVSKSPAKARFANPDGSISYTTYEDRVDAVVTFRVKGINTENGFMMGGTTFIGSGSTFAIDSLRLETQCTVLSVEPMQ